MDINVKEGQIVYLVPGVNKARRNGSDIVEGVLKTIGRKYYTVSADYSEYLFDKTTLRQKTNYTADYYLHFTKQEILDQREKDALVQKFVQISDRFSSKYKRLTLDQLRRIDAIVEESANS